ncbi:MAG: glycosyltransferase family 2 protein [Planctomycetes bacterium]|nr:glycosyltransferase family 2 protein [Planctomycetota bacterium]
MKLSVIMPNYNHGRHIGAALRSILEQSHLPDEIIVLDDGSTDNSLKILREYEARYDMIRVIARKENLGAVNACNVLFREASGDYIHGFPSDDIVLPGAYERAMTQLEAHPGVGVCCADYYMVDVGSGAMEDYRLGWLPEPGFMDGVEFAERCKGWWVPSFTTFINRHALQEAGYFLENLKWHCDWFAYFVTAFRHGVCYVPTPFAARRRHADAYGTKARRDQYAQERVLRTLLETMQSEAYRDVLGRFARSGAMLFFNNEIDRLIMSDPELWTPANIMLASLPLTYRMQACKHHVDRIWDTRLEFAAEKADLIREQLNICE